MNSAWKGLSREQLLVLLLLEVGWVDEDQVAEIWGADPAEVMVMREHTLTEARLFVCLFQPKPFEAAAAALSDDDIRDPYCVTEDDGDPG